MERAGSGRWKKIGGVKKAEPFYPRVYPGKRVQGRTINSGSGLTMTIVALYRTIFFTLSLVLFVAGKAHLVHYLLFF